MLPNRVRCINENGWFRGGHVPTRYFCEYECLQGYVTTIHNIANYDYFFNVFKLVALFVIWFYLDNKWQYYLPELHAHANIVNIGAYDPGISSNVACRAETGTRAYRHLTRPPLVENLGIKRDMAYNVGKNGETVAECYLLQ